MITIISGTNRKGSNSLKVAQSIAKLAGEQQLECQLLTLEGLSLEMGQVKDYEDRESTWHNVADQYVKDVNKLIVVAPEYNGGFPGVLKAFIDAIPPKYFHGKRAALVGVSSGHAGNLRGLEHLTGILHYLQVEVLPQKPKLSAIGSLLNEQGELVGERAVASIEKILAAL